MKTKELIQALEEIESNCELWRSIQPERLSVSAAQLVIANIKRIARAAICKAKGWKTPDEVRDEIGLNELEK
jgi:hypothetical protein